MLLLKSFAKPVPDEIFIELVEMLFAPVVPLMIIGVSFGGVGFVISVRAADKWIGALALLGMIVSFARAGLLLAYRRKGLLRIADAVRWERRYAAGSYTFATVLGVLNLVAMTFKDPLIPMLVTGLMFGYGSGVVSRLYCRPKICGITLALAALPTILGMILRMRDPGQANMAYGAQAALLALFFIGCVETIHYSYDMALSQLTAKRSLARLARLDPLTALPNRTFLQERYEDDFASLGRGDMIALLYLDLDGFKQVNDRFGHPTGDALLISVAMRLKQAVRDGDTAVRLGGDEFVVLQPRAQNSGEVRALADRVIDAIAAPYQINGRTILISACIGIAVAPQDARDLDGLMSEADAALYLAKNSRRPGTVCWSNKPAAAAAAA